MIAQERKYVLVINCGSSSLKYDIIEFPYERSIAKGTIERIGSTASILTHKTILITSNTAEDITSPAHENAEYTIYEHEEPIKTHSDAFNAVYKIIIDKKRGCISSPEDIAVVGHRVVHGGEKFSQSTRINEDVIRTIKDLCDLAPLHNPANLQGIQLAMDIFTHCPHIAVFDTAFHQTIPTRAFMYALPYTIYKEYGIRKYGFHGTSHQYVTHRAAEIMNKDVKKCNLITCHLGNGSSIAAIRNGKSIDTSMGFTPLGGLMMGSRSGDIDPAIIPFLIRKGMSADEIDIMLNKKSGIRGISGISNDMRDVEDAAKSDNRAVLALEMFAHCVRKFIGAYVAELSRVDMLVFTAGIGQFGEDMRKRICMPLTGLGICIDDKKNTHIGKTSGIISKDSSPVIIAVIPTNEELQIAIEAYSLYNE